MSLPNAIYVDGDYTIATACSAPVFSSPLPGLNEPVVLIQQFQQFNEWNLPLALNTAHPDYPDFVLVSESERQDIGGALVAWTRTYAKVPDTRYEGSSIVYPYPGYDIKYTTPGTSNTTVVTARLQDPLNTTAEIKYDYFLTGTGETYESFTDIPTIQRTRFYLPILNGLVEVGKQDVTILTDITVPTSDQYLADVAGKEFDIVAQDSQVSRWMGNIFQRVIILVQAL